MNKCVDQKDTFVLLSKGKQSYKGNIHCHSTLSDGSLPPEEVVSIYKEKGYSFLAFTDHDCYHDLRAQFDTSSFITIPAVECSMGWYRDVNKPELVGFLGTHSHHLIGLKYDETPFKEGKTTYNIYPDTDKEAVKHTNEFIAELKEKGFLVMYNHPAWSRAKDEDILPLVGLDFIEIFNYGTIVDTNNGYDNLTWQRLLDTNHKINAIADDDNHDYPDGILDSFGGWINVQAESLNKTAILDAMLNGNYYSSSGPEIKEFRIENGIAYIECSPVKRIYLKTGPQVRSGMLSFAIDGEYITKAEFKIPSYADYIRAEAYIDGDHMAWSNPIYFK